MSPQVLQRVHQHLLARRVRDSFFPPHVFLTPACPLSKRECPSCRLKCPSRRSLRADTNFDDFIRTIYPNRESLEASEAKIEEQVLSNQKALAESLDKGLRRQQSKARQSSAVRSQLKCLSCLNSEKKNGLARHLQFGDIGGRRKTKGYRRCRPARSAGNISGPATVATVVGLRAGAQTSRCSCSMSAARDNLIFCVLLTVALEKKQQQEGIRDRVCPRQPRNRHKPTACPGKKVHQNECQLHRYTSFYSWPRSLMLFPSPFNYSTTSVQVLGYQTQQRRLGQRLSDRPAQKQEPCNPCPVHVSRIYP